MALIGKIRERLGLSVGIIAVSLGLFVIGGDILGPNSALLGKNSNSVGEIAGENISRELYQTQYESLKQAYGNASEEMIHNQAWENLIERVAFQKQYDKLALTVTNDERVDMVQGNNIHPMVEQYFNYPIFRDSITGALDVNNVTRYLREIANVPEESAAWRNFEDNFLVATRLKEKYNNMLSLSTYVTSDEAKNEYNSQNASANANYLYVPFSAVPDSLVQVDDNMLRKYLNEHKEKYEVKESKSIRYVTFPLTPSADDTVYYSAELDKLKAEFADIEDDSVYASIHTEGSTPYASFTVDKLPQELQDMEEITEGAVIGPYLKDNVYSLYKVSGFGEDAVAYVKASHILFKADKDDAAARRTARAKASEVLREIRQGADFAEMARRHSEDGSAANGGDLGWYTKGRMVKPFEEASFGATKAGLINRLIETDYGYHIINVTHPQTNRVYKLATIEVELTASDETVNDVYQKADYFASSCTDLSSFEENAKRDSLELFSAANIERNSRKVGVLNGARAIVQWLYREAAMYEVSPVFQLDNDNTYVVAILTAEQSEGTARLEDVRGELEQKVKNELKEKLISDKLNTISGATLDETAEKYGSRAKVYSGELKLNNNYLPSVGNAPEAIGYAFSMKVGEKSTPFGVDNGVLIMELTAKDEASEIADYASYKSQLLQSRQAGVPFKISQAVKEYADIQDDRYKFY